MIRTFYCWKSRYRTKIIFLQLRVWAWHSSASAAQYFYPSVILCCENSLFPVPSNWWCHPSNNIPLWHYSCWYWTWYRDWWLGWWTFPWLARCYKPHWTLIKYVLICCQTPAIIARSWKRFLFSLSLKLNTKVTLDHHPPTTHHNKIFKGF